ITFLRHDTDSGEDMDESNTPPLEFQCTICHREQSMAHMNQALGIICKKPKNIVHPTAAVSRQFVPLPGTPASMVSAEDKASSERYMQLRNQISCIECTAMGTMAKFGFTSSSPPRPRFQCSHCKRIFNISNIIDMMSDISTQQQQQQLTTVSLSPPALEDDVAIMDAQQPTNSETDLEQNSILPIWLEDTPPPITSPTNEVITFLLDSVKKLTDQANENQQKFDYINTLIEQNEQLKMN
ncbi:hypothetical protein, partial, partial [Parasitella parasitica]